MTGKGYFTTFRLYDPTEAFLDLTWRPSDLEEMRRRSALCRPSCEC